jgi:tRNA 2-thiouridine synthesizing protein E
MQVEINGRQVETDEQGFLLDFEDWSEEFVEKMAAQDGLTLYDESWGLIGYFREYYQQYSSHPSMRQLVLDLGRQSGEHFHDRKQYEKFVYKLFPRDPIRELCKLAGLPKPEPGD